jgi:dTDP-glucose pyrophosphorylase
MGGQMKPTLLILAAGMGSRYGGLKQLDGMGPSGETILEYSVYDAIRAGFGKVVFVVRREFHQEFREKVSSRFAKAIQIDFAFQEMDGLPGGFQCPPGRVRPWGTAHAVLSARPVISEPFAVINADDFYGASTFLHLHAFLSEPNVSWPPAFCLVAYELAKTLSDHGSVSRGICSVDAKGFLRSVEERTEITSGEEGPGYPDAVGRRQFLPADAPTSMNCFGFTPLIFDFLENQFCDFLEARVLEEKSEFFLPTAVTTMIKRGQAKVKVLRSSDSWIGVTHADDRPAVGARLRDLIDRKVYPSALWADET